ncbi:MAG TPA: hypothetical protein VMD07_09700 [Candidatus Acidoferrales bacterium]|nr:hypothetical protein [Candidatus Acidoferrales bacterium]
MSEIGPINLMNAVDAQESKLSRTATDSIASIAEGEEGVAVGEIQQFNLGDVARKAGLQALAQLDDQAGATLEMLDTSA